MKTKPNYFLLILALLIGLLMSVGGYCQTNVIRNDKGQFVQLKAPKDTTKDQPTGDTFKGLPVYKGKKGGLYVLHTSKKTGNVYRQYLHEVKK